MRTGQEFCSIFIVIGMSETHMGIPLLNIFPTKEIKSCKMCLALLCCTVCDGAGTALHSRGKVGLAGKCSVPQGSGTCTCVHTSPARREQQPRCSPSRAEGTSPTPNPNGRLPRLGRTSVPIYWYLLYLLTEYLEYFLNLNCAGERNSPLNCDQPDCRQNLKHSPTSGNMCKVILHHISRQV